MLDDLRFFENGDMAFMLTCILALSPDDPTAQILRLVEVGLKNGVKRYMRYCCLRIPRSAWREAAADFKVIDLV